MASITRRGAKWLAQVSVQGSRKSKVFTTKAQAKAWAAEREAEAESERLGKVPRKKVGDLFDRYGREVSPTKRGVRWEQIRLHRMCNDDPLADIWLEDLRPTHIAEWRDRRLTEVSPSSVRREWNLFSNAFQVAVREWGWLTKNPMREVSRPAPTDPRDRRYTPAEIKRICDAAAYSRDLPPSTKTARVCAAFLLAIETGMRLGEIAALRPEDLMLERRHLIVTGKAVGGDKTAAARRSVPLSSEAIRILAQVSAVTEHDCHTVFGIDSASMSTLFRRIRLTANVHDATFHDSRHEATTRLSKKLEPLALARTLGHKDLKMLLVYYAESAEDIARRLD